MFCLCPRSSIAVICSIPVSPRYKSVREQRPRCNCFMTDFHKLFTVKLNKIIHKKTGASFLVAYVIYVSLVYQIVSCLLPLLSTSYHLCNFQKVTKMPTCTHTGWFVSVLLCPGQFQLACICLFVLFNNQLHV